MTRLERYRDTVRRIGRTGLGRRAGALAYRAAAELAASSLARIPGVSSVYLTGSLARAGRVEPAYSDIDLVAVCDSASVEAEVELLSRLFAWQKRASRLGGLFYNLDCLDVREVPYARAFGGEWETRFDAFAKCLRGEELRVGTVRRSPDSVRLERFGTALRRWFNTGARLIDPRTPNDDEALRSARRLALDMAELWAEVDAARDLARLRQLAESAHLPSTLEFTNRDRARSAAAEIPSVLVPAALEMLDAFAREVAAEFEGEFQVVGDARGFLPPPEIATVGAALVGDSFDSLALLRKGIARTGHVPVAVARDGAPANVIVREATVRLRTVARELDALGRSCRRLVPITPAIWSALALAEPAPFLGAAAAHPLFVFGRIQDPPKAPSKAVVAELLDARAVQSFVLCRGVDLRPRMSAEHRTQTNADRFALLGAIDGAIDGEPFDSAWPAAPPPPPSLHTRVEALRAFSEQHRRRLAPLLASRIVNED